MTSLRQGLSAAPGNRAPCREHAAKVPLPCSRQGFLAQAAFWGAAWGSLAFAGRGKLDIEIDAQRVLGGLLNTSPTFQFGTAVTSIAAGSVGEPSASTSRYLNTSAIVARRGLMRINAGLMTRLVLKRG